MASDSISISTVVALFVIWIADKTVGELMAIYFQRVWFRWMDHLDGQSVVAGRTEVRTQRDRLYGLVRRHRHLAKHFRLLATLCVVTAGIAVWSCATIAGLMKPASAEHAAHRMHEPVRSPAAPDGPKA